MRKPKSWLPALIVSCLAGSILLVGQTMAEAATGTLGNTAAGTQTDSDNANYLSGSKFTMPANDGAVTSMSVYVGAVGAAPNNQFQVGIYTNSNDRPGTRIANSASGTLQANSWNTVPITATLSPNTSYWLMYNTNGTDTTRNNMRFTGGGTSTFSAASTPFGTWPTTFASAALGGANFSIYATYTTADPPPPPPLPNSGPGGPVLVIASSVNKFTTYLGEILKAEGLNHYRMSDIANVSASTLANHDVVVLGNIPLTDAQASMLTTWVNGGGKLIAMRPDKKLAGLLGLTDAGGTLAEAWLRVNSSSGPGVGIVGTSIQYHGTADRYTLNGASSVATLYSNASTATSNPAVSTRTVGSQGGQAAAFTYDLARSVVLTRQGNPAWESQQRDGIDGYEAAEMFMGAASGAPDWNSLDNALIPIADEQQRLLANMITQMNLAKRPLPRFWYYPRGEKAVVIMTGDDHGNGGTTGRFDQYEAYSEPGCNVNNWECVRGSSYIFTRTPMTNAQALAYHNKGFELGLHIDTGCAPYGSSSALNTIYTQQLAEWRNKYTSVPDAVSTRTHCVEWDDWASQAKVKLQHGIRLDTDYYYFPASWVQNRPGYFNGTGTIQRFADKDGTLIDTFQATTQLTDESGQSYPATIDALLDGAYGPAGYYAAITANMHTDAPNSTPSNAVVGAALERGVPVVSGRQMLTWLDGRDGSSFQNITWSGSVLSFSVAGGTNGLRGMLPLATSAGNLASISSGGSNVAFTTEVVKGVTYAFFAAGAGSYVATYAAGDTVAPTVTSTTPADGATQVSTTNPMTVVFSEPMNASTVNTGTVELRDASNSLVGRTVAYNAGSTSAVITPTAPLAGSATYTVTVRGGGSGVKDAAGNPMVGDRQVSFTTAAGATSTTFGYTQIGAQLDSGDMNHMNGSRFVTGPSPQAITSLSVYMKTVQAAPNNQYQLAVYADSNGSPGALVASTTSGTLTANSWNTRPISATLTANTPYWLMYNTNGNNNMSYDAGTANQGAWSGSLTFGTWPATFGASSRWNGKFSIYASTGPDTAPPTVVSTAPADGATGIATTSPASIRFSEPMNAASISESTIELRDASNNLINRVVSYDPSITSAVVTPAALAPGATYTVVVRGGATGVKDVANNPLAANHTFTYTTATGQPPPSVFGYNTVGAALDSGSANHLNGSRFVTGPSGQTVTSMSVYMRTVVAAPNNQYQMAIYADVNGSPGALVATSGAGTLTANSWNSRPISATLAPNTAYWLMYNTNGNNNMSYDNGTANHGAYSGTLSFGTWPANFGTATRHSARYSIYAS